MHESQSMQPAAASRWAVVLTGVAGFCILLADLAPTSLPSRSDRGPNDLGWIGASNQPGPARTPVTPYGTQQTVSEAVSLSVSRHAGTTLGEIEALVAELRATELTPAQACAIANWGCRGCVAIHARTGTNHY